MLYTGKGGLDYDLESTPFAYGGEGEIYNIVGKPNLVAKLYKKGKESLDKEKKLIKMINFPPDDSVLSQIAWPQDILYCNSKFVGFVMPKLKLNEELNVIYEYGSSAKYPNMLWKNRIIIAKNLCAVLNSIHAVGHTCGDLNPKNISVDPNTGYIVFVDTDSYHVQDGDNIYRCDVGMPEYLAVEAQKKMTGGVTLATAALPTFTQDTDNFALAVHIFQLLMNGVHPFACAIIPSQSSVVAPQPSDNIIKGQFPFMQNIPGATIPAFAPKIDILPSEIKDLFKRAFIDGHNNPSVRPNPIEWHAALSKLETRIKECQTVTFHQYYNKLSKCPWCEADAAFKQRIQLSQSMISQTRIQKPMQTPTVQTCIIQTPTVITPPAAASAPLPVQNTKKHMISLIIKSLVVLLLIRAFVIFPVYNSHQNVTFMHAFNQRYDWPTLNLHELKQYAFDNPTRTNNYLNWLNDNVHSSIRKHFYTNIIMALIGFIVEFLYIILLAIFVVIPYCIIFVVFSLIYWPLSLITPVIDNITSFFSPIIIWAILGIIVGVYHAIKDLPQRYLAKKRVINIAMLSVVLILLISFWTTYTHKANEAISIQKAVMTSEKTLK